MRVWKNAQSANALSSNATCWISKNKARLKRNAPKNKKKFITYKIV